jgi:hypothetical protein
MPLLITFRGRPVKRRRRVRSGLRLVMVNCFPGQRCERLFVTEAEWSQHSQEQFLAREQMPDVRELARRASVLS